MLYVAIMPLGWIHNLPREEAEKLANELGLSAQGTLDELRRKVKDKWRAVETYLLLRLQKIWCGYGRSWS
jgi:hypothetical protein